MTRQQQQQQQVVSAVVQYKCLTYCTPAVDKGAGTDLDLIVVGAGGGPGEGEDNLLVLLLVREVSGGGGGTGLPPVLLHGHTPHCQGGRETEEGGGRRTVKSNFLKYKQIITLI